MKNILVLYHASCNDGIASAWVAYQQFGEEAEYLSWQYGKPLPDVKGRKVFMLDLSLPKEKIEEIKDEVEFLVIIDHHKTAIAELEDLYTDIRAYDDLKLLTPHPEWKVFTWLDTEYCGALLTWMFFNELSGSQPPRVLDFINDYDLWQHKLTGTREFNAWLASGARTIGRFDSALNENGQVRPSIIEIGHSILEYNATIVRSIKKAYVRETIWEGHRVALVNCPSHLRNEVADALSTDFDMVVCYTIQMNEVVYSLRSAGQVDVSQVARRVGGGGGHATSAAFIVPVDNDELSVLTWLKAKPTLWSQLKKIFFR